MNNIVEKITEEIENALSSVEWSEIPLSMKIEDILTQYVILHKGNNRNPYADVLHEWVEGCEIESKQPSGYWTREPNVNMFFDGQFRIKPSEPLYEYKVRMNFKDGSFEYTEKYFTKQEFDDFGFPNLCELAEATKRERKQ